MRRALEPETPPLVVYTIDVRSIPSTPFGRETFSCREDAESFIEELRRDNPGLASDLRIEERELGAGMATRTDLRSSSDLREVA
jgi:hypothetical protein